MEKSLELKTWEKETRVCWIEASSVLSLRCHANRFGLFPLSTKCTVLIRNKVNVLEH